VLADAEAEMRGFDTRDVETEGIAKSSSPRLADEYQWITLSPARICLPRSSMSTTRAGYLAHPGGNMAGVGGRERLHRLPSSCFKWGCVCPVSLESGRGSLVA
jgi:hypothetical protein